MRAPLALAAGLAVLAIGCGTPPPPDTSKIQVLDPTVSVASSSNLLDLYHQLDKVYADNFADTATKLAPEEKILVDKIGNGRDVKAELAKDHKLFADGIQAADKALTALSNNTTSNVDPMEHDKYTAYYTAIGESISARKIEYQAILAYEAKPSDDTRKAVVQSARDAQGKDLAYNMLKR